jgi:chromosome segregation ATPase
MKNNNYNEFEKNVKDFREYSYYSRVLEKPFDSIEELRKAEAKHYAQIKAKEDKAAAKKADAAKVEEAYKVMNAARKTYKEKLTALTTEYSNALADLKKTFEFGKNDIREKLAAAEASYQAALKEFTEKHPEGYHITLKDGDFETTISSQTNTRTSKKEDDIMDIFSLFFGI